MSVTGLAEPVAPSDSISNAPSLSSHEFFVESSALTLDRVLDLVDAMSDKDAAARVFDRFLSYQEKFYLPSACVPQSSQPGPPLGVAMHSSGSGASSSVSSSKSSGGFTGYKPPVGPEGLAALLSQVGTKPYYSSFQSLQPKYARGLVDGTSFSIHRYGSRGASVASSNLVEPPAGRCYLRLIAGGHKNSARSLLGMNPRFLDILSAPAHMFSVSCLFTMRVSRLGFDTVHISTEGTYTFMQLAVRYLACFGYKMSLTSSAWDGTLVQALSARDDVCPLLGACTEMIPYFLTVGAEDRFSSELLTSSEAAAASVLVDELFPAARRQWRYVRCIDEYDRVLGVVRQGVALKVYYTDDCRFVAISASQSDALFTPLFVPRVPCALLRALEVPVGPPATLVSESFSTLSVGDASQCRCAIHSWPVECEGLRVASTPTSSMLGPVRAALLGTHAHCAASEDVRWADSRFVGEVVALCATSTSYSSAAVPVSVRELSSANPIPVGRFGPGYCYLHLVRGRYRYRVARVLGPCPRLRDLLAVYRVVGGNGLVCSFDSAGEMYHVGVTSSSSLTSVDVHSRMVDAVASGGGDRRVGGIVSPVSPPSSPVVWCTVGDELPRGSPVVFLAGSSEKVEGEGWRERAVRSVEPGGCVFFSPRSADLSHLNVPLHQRARWERSAMSAARAVVFNFLPGTTSSISMMELGMCVASGKAHVVCDPGFSRSQSVLDLCHAYSVPVYGSAEAALFSAVVSASYGDLVTVSSFDVPVSSVVPVRSGSGSVVSVVCVPVPLGDHVCGGLTVRCEGVFLYGSYRVSVFTGSFTSECLVPSGSLFWAGPADSYASATVSDLFCSGRLCP